MVDREKFGERHNCFECGCKFYDMNRQPPVCPRCGVDVSKPPQVAAAIEVPADDDIIDDDDTGADLDDEEIPIDDLESTEELSEDEMGDD